MKDEIIVVKDDCSRIEMALFHGNVFITIADEYDYSARTSFSKIQIEKIIDTLTAMKENMD